MRISDWSSDVCSSDLDEIDEGDHGYDGQGADGGAGEPFQVLAFVQHDLQCAYPYHQQEQAYAVDGDVHARGVAVLIDLPRRPAGDESDRNVYIKDPRP